MDNSLKNNITTKNLKKIKRTGEGDDGNEMDGKIIRHCDIDCPHLHDVAWYGLRNNRGFWKE
jgi:hypothetical protein